MSEYKGNKKICCATCAYLGKEKLYQGQQVWLVCDRDVNGDVTLENIKQAIITHNVNEELDCIGWEDREAPEEDMLDLIVRTMQ